MSWTDVFPVLSEDQVTDFERSATVEELAILDEWCGVARTINPQTGKHLVVSSLFWKNAGKDDVDLPPLTREVMKNAAALGLVTRFSPWEHYVQPLLDGAAALKVSRPEIVFRVYLAADLEFLVEDFVAVGCEVMLMRGSSIRHNPGALWRFLALEEAGRWVTITDSDRAPQAIHDVERTEHIMQAGLGLWRVPYIFDSVKHGNNPGYYRPIIACQFGAVGGLPMGLLMRAMLWHTMRGSMPDRCVIGGTNGGGEVPIFGTNWPTYGFDEWFLIAAVYPRAAFNGVLTFVGRNEGQANHWFALDIEYVTWASPKSEIFYFGDSDLVKKEKLEEWAARPAVAASPVLDQMLAEKVAEAACRIAFPVPACKDPITLVVARYQEDVRWLLNLPEDVTVVLYNKGESIRDTRVLERINVLIPLENRGREADTYLYHLENHAHGIGDEWTVFCQGDPFPHSPDFIGLLERRGLWSEVQALTAWYTEDSDVPPWTARVLEDEEWIGGIAVRTELCSAHTLDVLNWQDEAWQGHLRDYRDYHRIPKGWSVSGHFLEACGLTELASLAWRASLTRFAYGAIFAVRNELLPKVPLPCVPKMRELARGHPSHAFVLERMWLHLFGMSFVTVAPAQFPAPMRKALKLAEA